MTEFVKKWILDKEYSSNKIGNFIKRIIFFYLFYYIWKFEQQVIEGKNKKIKILKKLLIDT
jgi:hypothetical protein